LDAQRLSRLYQRNFRVFLFGLGFFGAVLFCAKAQGQSAVLSATNSLWRYLDDGSDQGYDWIDPSYIDDFWRTGAAKLGYGDSNDVTVVSYGLDPNSKYVTTYFRQFFQATNASRITNLTARLLRQDGAVMYLNGEEILRSNMPDEFIDYLTPASDPVSGTQANTFYSSSLDPSLLLEGNNLLSVEIHLFAQDSPAMGFDLELLADYGPPPPLSLTRGPYLQTGTLTNIIVRWRTNLPTNSAVRYGLTPDALTSSITAPEITTEHIITLEPLQPGTKYFYAIDATDTKLVSGTNYFFITFPPVPKPTRIWAIGDSGTTGTGAGNAVGVRDAYEAFTANRYTDVWLMLGDNAYYSGTDSEYQQAVFNVYTNELRTTVLWSTIGNHESNQDPNPAPTIPYFLNFSFPQNGEAGGLASGTENYYSFDYGNIHFVCLDAMTATSRVPGSPMLTWLQNDLAANTNFWLIAFWHHPPYTKGSHNSDTEIELIQMRENAVPILESYGVDLVLSGHSHNYERSYLINGHYSYSSTFTPSMALDNGTGRPAETGAYLKALTGPSAGQGTVYAVAGSSGWATFRVGYHPAMFVSELQTGSLVIDIDRNRLDAKFLRETGAIDDSFTIIKGAPSEPLRLATFSTSFGEVNVRWKSIAGRVYQLQRATDLVNGPWTPIGDLITATGATTSLTTLVPDDAAQAFYRVVEIPN